MNLPNRVTVGRMLLAVVLFILLGTVCTESGHIWYVAFTLYVITVVSDGLDGYLARSRNEITTFVRIADPFADKIVICGVLVLTTANPQTGDLVPTWIVLLVLAREFLVSGLRGFLEGRGQGFSAKWQGKLKLVIQAIYCGAVLFYPGDRFAWVSWVAHAFLWATAAITLYSGLSYVARARTMLAEEA